MGSAGVHSTSARVSRPGSAIGGRQTRQCRKKTWTCLQRSLEWQGYDALGVYIEWTLRQDECTDIALEHDRRKDGLIMYKQIDQEIVPEAGWPWRRTRVADWHRVVCGFGWPAVWLRWVSYLVCWVGAGSMKIDPRTTLEWGTQQTEVGEGEGETWQCSDRRLYRLSWLVIGRSTGWQRRLLYAGVRLWGWKRRMRSQLPQLMRRRRR